MLFERHLDLLPPLRTSAWRKMAIGTWRTAKDPTVYGAMDLECDAALAYVRRISERTGLKVTLTHFLGRAVAEAFRQKPAINGVLRFGAVHPRRAVTLFFQVATDAAGEDLSGVRVFAAETKSVATIAREMTEKVGGVRTGSDRSYARMKSLMGLLPGWISGLVMDFAGFVQFGLNVWTPLFGTPKDPLGSVMITNVGSLGLDFALAPLVPYSRVPMVLALGAARPRVVAAGGIPAVRTVASLGVTFDHRIIDGVHAAGLAKVVEAAFADPEGSFGPP